MSSHAEIFKTKPKAADAKAKFFFVIKAENGQTLATSEEYSTKQSCEGGIAALYTIKGNVYSKDQTIDHTDDDKAA